MERKEVEEKLKSFSPHGLQYYYVRPNMLALMGADTFEGKPLSGRFDAVTPVETQGGRKSEATVHIDLDMQERVVNVRVDGFGLGE